MPTVSMKAIDLSKLLKPHNKKWVALTLDHKKVVGAGATLQAAKQKAQKKAKDFIFLKVPPSDSYYVPYQG